MPRKEVFSTSSLDTYNITMYLEINGTKIPDKNVLEIDIYENITTQTQPRLGDCIAEPMEVYGTVEGTLSVLPGNGIWPALATYRKSIGTFPSVEFVVVTEPEHTISGRNELGRQRDSKTEKYTLTLHGVVFTKLPLFKSSTSNKSEPFDVSFGAKGYDTVNTLPYHDALDISGEIMNRLANNP